MALLPRWARWPLRLPWLPVTEATVLRAGGEAVTRTIRWALPAGIPRDDAVTRRLVLASSSPRRRELLGVLGVPFRVVAPAGVDETPLRRRGAA